MKKKNYRGVQCVKQSLSKCKGVCRTYSKIHTAYVVLLQEDPEILTFQCNVPLIGVEEDLYSSDIVAVKQDGSTMVRECVWRKNLSRPTTARLLDVSRNYWIAHGVEDWGIVIEKENSDESK